MKRIAGAYEADVGKISYGTSVSTTPMLSTVVAKYVSCEEVCQAGYWVRNLTSPVRFYAAIQKLLSRPTKKPEEPPGEVSVGVLDVTEIVEIGPHSVLEGPISDMIQVNSNGEEIQYIPTLVRGKDAATSLLSAVGKLYCAGCAVDLMAVNDVHDLPRRILSDLPQYPFDHSCTHWTESRLSKGYRFQRAPRHDLLGTQDPNWNPYLAQWRNTVQLSEMPWLKDHTVSATLYEFVVILLTILYINNQCLFPAGAMLAMVVEGLKQLKDPKEMHLIQLRDVYFSQTMIFDNSSRSLETQLVISSPTSYSESDSLWSDFRLFEIRETSYTECCRGNCRVQPKPSMIALGARNELDHMEGKRFHRTSHIFQKSTRPTYAMPDPYEMLRSSGLGHGPSFQTLENVSLDNAGYAVADVKMNQWRTE